MVEEIISRPKGIMRVPPRQLDRVGLSTGGADNFFFERKIGDLDFYAKIIEFFKKKRGEILKNFKLIYYNHI